MPLTPRRFLPRLAFGAAAAAGAAVLAGRLADPQVSWLLRVLLTLPLVHAALRPADALLVLAAFLPLVTSVGFMLGAGGAAGLWALPLVVATLTGWNLRKAAHPEPLRIRPGLLWAAVLLIGLTLASLSVELRVDRTLRPEDPGPFFHWFRALLAAPRGTSRAFDAALVVLAGVGTFIMTAAEAPPRRIRLLSFTLLGIAASAVINLTRVAGAVYFAEDRWSMLRFLFRSARMDEHYGDVNAAASIFVLAAVTALGFALAGGARRLLWLAAAALYVTALWFTGSRIGAAAFGFGIVALFVLRAIGRGSAKQRWQALGAAALVSAAGFAVVAAMPERFVGWGAERATEYRLGFLETSSAMIRQAPVFGMGVGRHWEEFPSYAPPWMLRYYKFENAHNNFMQFAAELGFLGVAAWLLLVVGSIGGPRADDGDRAQLQGFQAGIAGFLATCLTGHPLLVVTAGTTFYLALGLLEAWRPESAYQRVGAIQPRWTRWAAAAIAAGLIASIPARWPARRSALDLEHVARGVSLWGPHDPAPRTRTIGRRALFYIPTDVTAAEFDVRRDPLVREPVTLDFLLEGRHVHRAVLDDESFRRVRIIVSESAPHRFLRVDVAVTGPTLPFRNDAVDAGAVMTRIKPIGRGLRDPERE